MSERRTVFRDAAAGTGGLGPNQSQLYTSGDKLMAQKYEGQPVEVADLGGGSLVPVGVIWSYAGATAPTGWLLCDGSEVAAAYTELDTLLNDAYGEGTNGRSKLPDLRGRVPVGPDAMGGTDAGRLSANEAVGSSGGAETVDLAEANIPQHGHTATVTDTSGPSIDNYWYGRLVFSGSNDGRLTTSGSGNLVKFYQLSVSHSVSVTNDNWGGDGSGGVDGVNKMPPYLVTNYIIKHD